MDSFFNAMFAAASPHLMNAMGTRVSVTITLGQTILADRIDAIIRHQNTEDAIDEDGYEYKQERMEIDILRDPSSSYGGLADNYNNARATIAGEDWEIESYGNLTHTWARLSLLRVVPRSRTTSGRYRS